MKKFTSNEIRKMWLEFFRNNNHYELPSVSLIPFNDSSLLWINSGVATLKPYFNGTEKPPSKRLTNSQKSIRTNDIENVGYTERHHTLFEMLGNFSIGDYFKKEAIIYAWEFLTNKKWIGFDSNKLYVTIYKYDNEAYEIWKNIVGLKNEQIIKGNKDTNFWEIGKGPCGTNTEIFYDRGEKYDPKYLGIKLLQENLENDRYLEVWNIVFSQYNNNGDGTYTDLPKKNIDTGAGLERITSIVQKTSTNYETDLFMPIINVINKLVDKKFHYKKNNSKLFNNNIQQKKNNISFKVISDHIRTITFAIADGVFPGNKERGYVIRRLIRRASLYGKKIGLLEPFLFKLVGTVVKIMNDYYYYLIKKQTIIEKTVLNEEEKFFKTLEKGNKIFNEIKKKYGKISKEHAFNLFESYGLPIELIKEKADKEKIEIDIIGFYELLKKSKIVSKINKKNNKIINFKNEILNKLNFISKFVGYEYEQVNNIEIIFMFINNKPVKKIINTTGYIILKETPFYAEKNGQAADHGLILNNNTTAYVLDVKQGPNKHHIHFVKVEGTLQIGDFVSALIDSSRRFYIKKNHSGTHLIFYALRQVLGNNIIQINSYNDDKHLRIDISHNKKISLLNIIKIENLVINIIKKEIPCEIIFTDIKTAIEVHKALYFYTEKYYDKIVRIVKFKNFSCEFCWGTHVENSKDIEDIFITNIESKGSGIFRIYAITSNKTISSYLNNEFLKEKTKLINYFNKYNENKNKLYDFNIEKTWNKINDLIIIKTNLKKLKELIFKFKKYFKYWQKKYDNILIQEFVKEYNTFLFPKQKNNINILTYQFKTKINFNYLKVLIDSYKINYKNLLIFFTDISNENKIILFVSVSSDLFTNYNAKKIINKLNKLFDGKGGGNNSIAQSVFNIKNKNVLIELLNDPIDFLKYND